MTPKKSLFSIKFIDNIIIGILTFFNGIFNDFGLSIIATTVLVKLILLPLSIHQEKQQRKNQELSPKLNELNKKYPNKGPEYNKAVAELYKTENVNPMLGCLPLLIQLPVFVGLFNAFYYSPLLADSHFLWFELKKPDQAFVILGFAINILPIITALLQVLQQKLLMTGMDNNNTQQENSMQTMLYTMPLIMLVLFYKMPSALNLYYLVNILLSIIQSYVFIKLRKKSK